MLSSLYSYYKTFSAVTDLELKDEIKNLFKEEIDKINLEVLIINETESPQKELLIRNVFGNLAERFISHQPDLTFSVKDKSFSLINIFIIDDFGNGVAIVFR